MDRRLVFLVDDDSGVRHSLMQTLELEEFTVVEFSRAEALLRELRPGWQGVVVSDLKMPGMGGIKLLKEVRRIDGEIPVVLMTGHGDIETAVQALHEGAADFLTKPFGMDEFADRVKKAFKSRAIELENRDLRARIDDREMRHRLLGNSSAAKELRKMISHLSRLNVDVLIEGETGTGKEVVASELHRLGSRPKAPFVAVNCGAIPENIIESELFGHEAGAFTGAQKRRIGKFEHANKGTIFLDEIESMPLHLQVKILRVVQERVIERLGSNKLIPLDVRIIASTKTDLQKASERNEFREDLFYRLNVVTIKIPPLRERKEDIPMLFKHFADLAAEKHGWSALDISKHRIAELCSCDWPGNIRELQHVAERYVVECALSPSAEESITLQHQTVQSPRSGSLKDQVQEFEAGVIRQAYKSYEGDVPKVCEILKLPRKTLYDKLKKYGIDRSELTEATEE